MFPFSFIKDKWINKLGAWLMPHFNWLMNKLTGFEYSDSDLQNAVNVYPGDKCCRMEQPHAKWHEEAANGLLDFIFLANKLVELTE